MRKSILILVIACVVLLLTTACAKATPEAQSELYRGKITSVSEDGDILVAQQDGYNYGQPEILFHLGDSVDEATLATLRQDAFVEVTYSGALTRSIPPQGTAISIMVISTFSDGIIQNGVIQSVEKSEDGYQITILPIGVSSVGPEEDLSVQVILQVSADALEGLSEDDLKAGTQVSAVTQGIATASIPPRMPVYVLTPYGND